MRVDDRGSFGRAAVAGERLAEARA